MFTGSSREHHRSPEAQIMVPIFQNRKLRLQEDFSELRGLPKFPLEVEVEVELEIRSFHIMFYPLSGPRKPVLQD